MLRCLILCLSLLVPVCGFGARIASGSQESPDGRFSVDASGADDSLKIVDSLGRPLLVLQNSASNRGIGVYWSRDSQRVVVVIQWKWDAVLEAAKFESGHWSSLPVLDFTQELNEKAQLYLGIKIINGPWSDYGSYFEDLKWQRLQISILSDAELRRRKGA
jgi:hypothetical protein